MRGRVRFVLGAIRVRERPADALQGVGIVLEVGADREQLEREDVEALRDELSRWLQENARR
jgi:hypothetical protein